MNIYRLQPVDPESPSWQLSSEKGSLWTAAVTPFGARDLVARRTAIIVPAACGTAYGSKSPWLDFAITSCVLDPSMTQIDEGTVVREDGSSVGD